MITKAQGYRLENEAITAVRSKLTAIERGMLTWAVLDPGDKVLDMNLRDGLMLDCLARDLECEICGISDQMESVKHARACLQNADILYASPEDIPWRENSFDAVFLCSWKLEENDSEKALQEALRVLKPGGQLLLGLIHYPAPLRQMVSFFAKEGSERQQRSLQRKTEWLKRLKTAGYEEITWQQVDLSNGVAIAWKEMNTGNEAQPANGDETTKEN